MPASESSRIWRAVIRLSLGTRTLPSLPSRSNFATSPRSRSGTRSICEPFFDRWNVSKTKTCRRISALLAFGHVERRRQQRIAHELEPRVPGVAGNREDRGKGGLEPFVLARLRRRRGLQEGAIGRKLRFQQERHLQDAGTLREALAN